MYLEINNLEININNFKKKFNQKERPLVFKPNSFDLLISDLIKINKFIYFKFLNNIVKDVIQMIKKIIQNLNLNFRNTNHLEKKIINQEKIIEETLKINNNLSLQINELDKKINHFINFKSNYENNHNKITNNLQNTKDLISKEKFYQDENLRLSSQLQDTKKKFEIMKQEIEKYKKQRSNLINKINSVNDIIEDTNIVTNVFENEQNTKKIEIIDTENIKKKTKVNLDEEVFNIFRK